MSMVDLYEIGISFIIERDIFSDVDDLSQGMGTLQEAIDKVNASLATTADLLGSLRGAAGGMAASWDAAAAAAERMSAAADRMGGGGGGGGGGDPDRPDPGPYPPSGGSGHQISPWDYIIAGGVAYEAGRGGVTAAYDNAATIQHQEIQMQNMGAPAHDTQSAASAAQSLQQQYPGLSQENAMTIIRDAYMQTRNMPEAIGMANQLAEAAYVLQGNGQTDAAEEMYSAMRAGELRGLLNKKNPDGSTNLSGFEAFINAFVKAADSTGGRVQPEDAMAILRNAGPEGILMNQDAFTEALILSTDLGASQTGTSINALATQLLGGKMSQGAAQNLRAAGLLPDSMFEKKDIDGKEQWVIRGEYKNGLGNVLLPSGALKDQQELMENPIDWIQNTFLPAIEKQDGNDPTKILASIYADTSRIPGARLIAETIFQDQYLQRQLGFIDSTPGVGQAAANLKNDPQNVGSGVVTAFDAFMAQIGSDGMPTATAQLRALTSALNGLTDWAKQHPGIGNDAFRGGEAVAVGGAGAVLIGVYHFIRNMLGGKGGSDVNFGDVPGEAGEGIPLGDVGGGAAVTGSGLATALVPLIVPAVLAYMETHQDPLGTVPGRYGIRGQPVPVTIIPDQGGAALPVQVTNPHQIAKAAATGLAGSLNGPQAGTSGIHNRTNIGTPAAAHPLS